MRRHIGLGSFAGESACGRATGLHFVHPFHVVLAEPPEAVTCKTCLTLWAENNFLALDALLATKHLEKIVDAVPFIEQIYDGEASSVLAMADWLEERGDPLAFALRTMCCVERDYYEAFCVMTRVYDTFPDKPEPPPPDPKEWAHCDPHDKSTSFGVTRKRAKR